MNLTLCIKAGDESMREGYLIAFNYDEQAVEELKRAVPHTERSYNPDSRQWWVSKAYEDTLDILFSNFDALAHKQGTLF